MRERLERRLGELEAEQRAGQRMLADLEAQQTDLRDTLLRVSGAIHVLRELLEAEQPSSAAAGADVDGDGPLDRAVRS